MNSAPTVIWKVNAYVSRDLIGSTSETIALLTTAVATTILNKTSSLSSLSLTSTPTPTSPSSSPLSPLSPSSSTSPLSSLSSPSSSSSSSSTSTSSSSTSSSAPSSLPSPSPLPSATPSLSPQTFPLLTSSLSTTMLANELEVFVEDDCRFRPTFENYITIVSFCIIFCLSVVGNAIVVVVILQQRSMRSVTNIYLLNLAISDLMLSVVCMPPTLVSSVIYCWMFGDLLCKLFAYLQPVVVTASAYTLAVIAFERYYAICKPLHSRIWHTRSHAYAMITLVWLISVLANLFMLFMFELQTYNVNGLTCAPRHQPILHFGYQIYMTSVLLLIPLCIMIVLYGSVIHSLRLGMKVDYAAAAMTNSIHNWDRNDNERRQSCNQPQCTLKTDGMRNKNSVASMKQLRSGSESIPPCTPRRNNTTFHFISKNSLRSTHSERSIIAKQRVIKMLIVIVIIFFCCWTPNYMWWLLLTAQDSFRTFDIWNSQVNTAITVLCYISSCANPITYCFLNKKFRSALLISFGCRQKSHSKFQTVYLPEIPDTPRATIRNKATDDLPISGNQRMRSKSVRHETMLYNRTPANVVTTSISDFSRSRKTFA